MMSKWWTYSLRDFLLFSPSTYYRLLELHNATLWPWHIPALVLGMAVPVLLGSGWVYRHRAVAGVLGAVWLWVAWSFLLGRYAAINWTAPWFAALFAVEAVLVVIVASVGGQTAMGQWHHAEIAVYVLALLVQPVAGLVAGRSWQHVEVFAIAPDPTAIATLGLLVPASRVSRWLLAPIPILWCAISGATLWAMEAPDAWVPPVAAVLALFGMVRWSRSA